MRQIGHGKKISFVSLRSYLIEQDKSIIWLNIFQDCRRIEYYLQRVFKMFPTNLLEDIFHSIARNVYPNYF